MKHFTKTYLSKDQKPVNSWVGDFLLLIDSGEKLPAARMGGTWELAFRTQNAGLYFAKASKQWRGAPLKIWQNENERSWLLGLVWGDGVSTNPADWPGHFILIEFDEKNNSWQVNTNRAGTYHAYYSKNDHRIAVSSYSPAAAWVTDRIIDTEAVSGFFSFGFFPQNRTFIKGLKIIPPHTELVIDPISKEIVEKQQWTWVHFPEKALSFDESVDAFADLFHKIIQEQIDEKSVAFPISGGLDSRSTIAALQNLSVKSDISSYSYGYGEDSIETKIAEEVASSANLPFTSFSIQPYLFDDLSNVMNCIEGFQDLTQTRQAFISNYLAKTSNYVMAAHLGDLWLDDVGYHSNQQEDLINFAHRKFCRKGSDKLLGLLSEDGEFKKKNEILLRDFLSRALTPLDSIQDPDFRIKALKIETYVFRWSSASLRMYQPGAFPLLPFFDPRFFNFFCTLPTSYVAGRKLQIAYLKRYAPKLAHITWQKFDANLYNYQYFNTWLLPKRACRKLTRLITGKQIISRNWEVQFLNERGRAGLGKWLLEPGLKIHNYVGKKQLADFINDFYAVPDAGNGYAISMLLTFSAWLEAYG